MYPTHQPQEIPSRPPTAPGPEFPDRGRSAELPPLPPLGTPPFPDPGPRIGGPAGSMSTGGDYLLYQNLSATQGGAPLDRQNHRYRPGTDAAQFPGQKTDPAHF